MISGTRKVLMFGGAIQLISGVLPGSAVAQETGDNAATHEVQTLEMVTVTGSRIGTATAYNTPTPVTALSIDTMVQTTPSNISDALNKMMPQFANSSSEVRQSVNYRNPSAGNVLNLRNLGANRSLVLFDGHRVPPTSFDGTVDTNIIPQLLVDRVEVVTGGASAVYGSDAVVGVVNYVLDKDFRGMKGTVQGGMSEDGHGESWRGGVAAGGTLFNDRLHLLGSIEHYEKDPLMRDERSMGGRSRPLMTGTGTAANPYRAVEDATLSIASFGGLIFSGPLFGNTFNPDGTMRPLNPGQPTSSLGMRIGGDGLYFATNMWTSAIETDQAFARAAFDLTDKITVYVQASGAQSSNVYESLQDLHLPGGQQLTIFSGNAFLHPSVQQAMTNANVPSFVLTRYGRDFPFTLVDYETEAYNAAIGLDGALDWGSGWSWNVQYAHGDSTMDANIGEGSLPRSFAAADAVRDPATGNIVCRVTLINPAAYPGCVPANYFGEGSPSPESIAYVMGRPARYQTENTLDAVSASVGGDLLSLWAGPLSTAFGVEYRKQELKQTSNTDPTTPPDFTGLRGVAPGALWGAVANVGSADGAVNVREAFVEMGLPLLKDKPFVQSLDLNAAYRYTDYSTSGRSPSWKVGLTYEPSTELRFRAALSSDIRAPSLFDLYAGSTVGPGPLIDVHTGVNGVSQTVGGGNPDLDPERGRTWTVGLGYRPDWLPNFTAAVDFYNIEIEDAIGTIPILEANNACEASGGTAPECALIVRPLPFSDRSPANFPTQIFNRSLNLGSIEQSGFDIDMAYRVGADTLYSGWTGDLTVRVIATHIANIETQRTSISPVVQTAGVGYSPKWSGNVMLTYQHGPLSVSMLNRATGKSKRDALLVFADHGANPNRVYTDLNLSYEFEAQRMGVQTFLSVANLLDKDPPILPSTGGDAGPFAYPTLLGVYDIFGRYYTLGARVKF